MWAGEDTGPYPAPQRTSRSHLHGTKEGLADLGQLLHRLPKRFLAAPEATLPLVPPARRILREALEEQRCPRTAARCAPRRG